MQPTNNNQNPYYPARETVVQPVQPGGQSPISPSGGQPNFNGFGKKGPAWGWIITVTLLTLVILGVTIFAFWAFGERQDYKNNSDKKSAAAAEVAKKQTTEVDNKRFAEELKNPLKTYVGPESYGSVTVQYPKTWSAYIGNQGLSSSTVLDLYFHPDIVPTLGAQSDGSRAAIALNVQVLNQSYNSVLTSLKPNVDNARITASPYALPKMPNQAGTIYRGTLSNGLTGTQVVLPLRDKTLILTTNTDQYLADFMTYILPNLTFVP